METCVLSIRGNSEEILLFAFVIIVAIAEPSGFPSESADPATNKVSLFAVAHCRNAICSVFLDRLLQSLDLKISSGKGFKIRQKTFDKTKNSDRVDGAPIVESTMIEICTGPAGQTEPANKTLFLRAY